MNGEERRKKGTRRGKQPTASRPTPEPMAEGMDIGEDSQRERPRPGRQPTAVESVELLKARLITVDVPALWLTPDGGHEALADSLTDWVMSNDANAARLLRLHSSVTHPFCPHKGAGCRSVLVCCARPANVVDPDKGEGESEADIEDPSAMRVFFGVRCSRHGGCPEPPAPAVPRRVPAQPEPESEPELEPDDAGSPAGARGRRRAAQGNSSSRGRAMERDAEGDLDYGDRERADGGQGVPNDASAGSGADDEDDEDDDDVVDARDALSDIMEVLGAYGSVLAKKPTYVCLIRDYLDEMSCDG